MGADVVGTGAKPKFGAARPVRVALLDGEAALHTVFRDQLAASEPDWQLDTYTHGTPAWPALRANPPQLVLLAQTLPDGCGMEYLRRCKRRLPALPVVILTTPGGANTPLDALVAGAHGYWMKRADAAGLVTQLRKVLAGQIVMCAEAERLLPLAFAALRQRTLGLWGCPLARKKSCRPCAANSPTRKLPGLWEWPRPPCMRTWPASSRSWTCMTAKRP